MKKEILKILIYIVMTLSLNAYGVETLIPVTVSEKIVKLVETLDGKDRSISDAEIEEPLIETKEQNQEILLETEDIEENMEENMEETLMSGEAEIQVDSLNSEVIMSVEQPQFIYKGNLYTMGVTTLQNIIDDGSAAISDEITKLDGKTIPAKQLSDEIILNSHCGYGFFVAVYNNSNEDKAANECTLGLVRILPDDSSSVDLDFDFGFSAVMMENEIKDVLGEPSEVEQGGGINTYKYHARTDDGIISGYDITFLNGTELSLCVLYQ